jgi:hypothetical protein
VEIEWTLTRSFEGSLVRAFSADPDVLLWRYYASSRKGPSRQMLTSILLKRSSGHDKLHLKRVLV